MQSGYNVFIKNLSVVFDLNVVLLTPTKIYFTVAKIMSQNIHFIASIVSASNAL